jgi:hypothetical protein
MNVTREIEYWDRQVEKHRVEAIEATRWGDPEVAATFGSSAERAEQMAESWRRNLHAAK